MHYNPFIHDYSKDYLTFVAKESGTFTFTPQSDNVINYSTDNGTTWTEGNSVEVNSGDKVMWKGEMTPFMAVSPEGIGNFSSTGRFDVQGNIMSLLYGDNFKGQTDLTGKGGAFYNLFASYNNSNVVNAENLILPATTLAQSCYQSMFFGCTSLTTAPQLPATTLATGCYSHMFQGCTSLTTASELPATTLANSCYSFMFNGCTSLTTAPELPAIILVRNCYWNMFNGCTSLNYINAMFTTTPSSMYTSNWVSDVASNGIFIKNSTAQWDVTGVDGIPANWTVQTATE